jgi:hypothetical protein
MMEAFMMKPAALILALLIFSSRAVLTQIQREPVHAPDGGTREMIISISVPPLPNAPFSATVNTEWTRYLEDGATLIIKNHRLIARDGKGRVFQERRWLAPDGSPVQSRLTRTEIADPATHTIALCDPNQQICELRFYGAGVNVELPPTGPSPNGAGSLTRQDLGTQTVNGLETIGTREIQTINAAVAGTDRPLSITKEFWYSRHLGLNLSTKRSDPRSGVEVFTVTDINPSEPDPSLFALPQNARTVDYRAPVARR